MKKIFLAYGTLSHTPIDINYPYILTGTNTTLTRRKQLRSVAKEYFVDVGINLTANMTPTTIATTQAEVNADIASCPDIVGNEKITIERTKEWVKAMDHLGYVGERVFVLQSDDRSVEGFLRCLDGHKETNSVNYAAVGGLTRDDNGMKRPLWKNMQMLQELLPQIKEKVHIFGIGLGIQSVGILENLKWDSLDSSTAVFAARDHKIFDYNLRRIDMGVNIPRGKNSGVYVKMMAIANQEIASIVLNKGKTEEIERIQADVFNKINAGQKVKYNSLF